MTNLGRAEKREDGPKEVETKVLEVDPVALSDSLVVLGTYKIQETRLFVHWFQPPKTVAGEEPWYLRIRTDAAGHAETTWKSRSTVAGVARSQGERNVDIGRAEDMAAIYTGIGLEHYAYQEKDRISWQLREWRMDLDTYPGIPPYLEIEGQSDEHIQEAIRLLGLEGHRTSSEGERKLIQDTYHLDWYDMRFDDQAASSATYSG